MAEWLKAAVLKTVVPKGTVGSNPTPSATFCGAKFGEISPICFTNWRIRQETLFYRMGIGINKYFFSHKGEMAELAEGARLLSELWV